MRTFDTNKLL